jgi:hypothetical protein
MTTSISIQFLAIGRQKWTDDITFTIPKSNYKFTPDDIAAMAFKEARKHLISAGVETVYNQEKNEGSVFAGFRCVGKFKVKEESSNVVS